MRLLRLFPLFAFCTLTPLSAATAPAAADWDRVAIAPMKTSIYVGSVTLATGMFERQGATLATTYAAKVFPWIFWSETGHITIQLTEAVLAQLARGETTEFTGDAVSHKGKPRRVTGRAQPADASSGKIKVRIKIDDVELIFNGPYQFSGKKAP